MFRRSASSSPATLCTTNAACTAATPLQSRKNWIAALDRLAALNPTMVVAGHKKPGAPDSPSTIQDTKRYLEDFDRLQKAAASDQELFDEMTELYPHWVANQSWLMFGFPQS